MKLISTNKYTENKTEIELETLVKKTVDGGDYGRGQLETLEYTIENQSVLIAKLIERLNFSETDLNELFADWDEILTKV